MPKTQKFSEQALRRCVPQTTLTDTLSTLLPYHQNTKIKQEHPVNHISTTEQTNDPQDEFTINLLRAILKRPSAKKGAYTKHVTFNPQISYIEPENNKSNTPTDDEEDSQQTRTDTQTDDEDDDQHKCSNDIAAWIKTIEANTNKIDTTLSRKKYTAEEYARIPCTHTQEDIDNIPDIVDANNVNSNLNDAQLPYLTTLYGYTHMKQTKQQTINDTRTDFTITHHQTTKQVLHLLFRPQKSERLHG